MASVTSLDKDLRKMRLDKYTPGAAKEVREWIESTLGRSLPAGDLLEALKDGVALCNLVNLALPPPGIKFKTSSMPFVQMENISHFLRACQQPPLNLQQHDMFLTVDLYEAKDPAQVLQCLGAFSRAANAANPSAFPTAIGRSRAGSILSPQSTGPVPLRGRGASNASNGSSVYGTGNRPTLTATRTGDSGSGRWSPTKSPTSTSSWSRREHEGSTSPAWNIAQYGYMGGASQGNLGIAFGGRRQITSAGPHVPNLAEKERMRKLREAEAEQQRVQMEEEERRRKADLEAEEQRARLEEEKRWEEETRRQRDEEARRAEDEKRKWEEEERQWRLADEKRRKEEEEAERRLADERSRSRSKSDARLRGQFLSQYQAEQGIKPQRTGEPGEEYRSRIEQLEKELERARQREQEYERERQGRPLPQPSAESSSKSRTRSRSRPAAQARAPSRQDSWSRDEREVLRTAWDREQEMKPSPLGKPQNAPTPRPLPDPATAAAAKPEPPPPNKLRKQRTGEPIKQHRTGEQQQQQQPPQQVKSHRTGEQKVPPPKPMKPQTTGGSSRPLPDPKAYSNRTVQFLPSNPAPAAQPTQPTYSRELGATAERDGEDRRRQQAQQRTKAGGWASKSLLEREMEMERQRQKEWEEAQEETAKAKRPADGAVDGIGGGVGGRWDVGQWSGYTGGDSQNRGQQGIGAGRRQIVGPRPLPGR
ncbi:hypothetical protein M9X92_006965 [Pyricularia oryzae]|nr:hypothetical protein M9X92_006965 [Pyricularia oryzae]